MVALVLPRKVWPIAVIVACALAESTVLGVGIDDLDEGYFVQQAVRIIHGQVPYRDFESLYSPGLVYVHAALFGMVGGPSLLPPRVLALAARAALGLLLFALARPLVRHPAWAAAPAVLIFVALDDAPVRWEPHPGWPSVVFALIAIWCLSHRPARRWVVGSAAAAAVAYAFKQNTGVLMLGAILLWTRRTQWWLPLTVCGLVTLLWLVPLWIAVGDPRELRVLVGDVAEGGLFATPDLTNVLPLACLGAGLWLLRRDSDPRLRWYLVSGVALYLTEFPRMDTPHLAWSAPALLVLGSVALDRIRLRVALPFVGAALVLLAPTWSERVSYLFKPMDVVDGVVAPTVTASELNGVIADIRQRSAPGEPIFVYPTSPLLYVLADRPNATRWDHLNPGAADPAQIDQIVADLARVKLVVISDFWQPAWGPPRANARLESWLSARFHDVARHGSYRVLAAD